MGRIALRIITALLPLILTPLLFSAINAGMVNFGGGEKDIILVLPWLLWSALFALAAIIGWTRGASLLRSLLQAGLWATLLAGGAFLLFALLAPRLIGVSM